ncbi:MAG: glucose-1-phosphate thymidylyltransferase [Chlorobi bacterium]|nr:glucose-1-phosphate thymidylyltransferase [Chlorobiota bacterium]
MDRIILVDTPEDWKFLLPLTYFREIPNIRLGILNIREKWEKYAGVPIEVEPVFYLKEIFGGASPGRLFVRSSVLPTPELSRALSELKEGECLTDEEGEWVACRTETSVLPEEMAARRSEGGFDIRRVAARRLRRPWEAVELNGYEIERDGRLLGLESRIPPGIQVLGTRPVYVDPSAEVDAAVLDAREGPVYVGPNVRIFPFSYLKGPVAVLNHSLVKAGTRIYNGTTLGPWTKVGGEIKNVLFFGYSNKGHDGFLGDAVVGQWVNFGAGTSNSNLKNNYSPVRMYVPATRTYESTGRQFLGLVMGDHSKTAINTSLNTGTVAGVSANIFTRDFPPKFIPSFNWGGDAPGHTYHLERAKETARKVMQRRQIPFDERMERLFDAVWAFSARIEQGNQI